MFLKSEDPIPNNNNVTLGRNLGHTEDSSKHTHRKQYFTLYFIIPNLLLTCNYGLLVPYYELFLLLF